MARYRVFGDISLVRLSRQTRPALDRVLTPPVTPAGFACPALLATPPENLNLRRRQLARVAPSLRIDVTTHIDIASEFSAAIMNNVFRGCYICLAGLHPDPRNRIIVEHL